MINEISFYHQSIFLLIQVDLGMMTGIASMGMLYVPPMVVSGWTCLQDSLGATQEVEHQRGMEKYYEIPSVD
jgi:hypothetical protein